MKSIAWEGELLETRLLLVVPNVTLTLAPAAIAEASGVTTVTATLSSFSGQSVTVTLGFSGTATNVTDYTRSATQIVIPAGSLSRTMTLTAVQDTRFEGNETVIVDITGVTNGTENGTQRVTATINDDDTAPTVALSLNPTTMAEATGVSTVTATLSAISGLATTVTLGCTGTATNVTDYTRSATQIVIPAGSLSSTMTLTAAQDTLFEGNETVIVDITGVTNGTESGTQQVTATILDDDTAPIVALSFNPTTMAEATGVSTVTATLSAISGLATTVTLGFTGTATNVTDYTSSVAQIVIPAGSLSATMTLTAVQDTLFEGNETVIVDISGVNNGTESGTQQVTATILDDDTSPTVTLALSPGTIAEAAGASTVTATLSAVSGLVTTISLGFTGTATNITDYTRSAVQIVIPAGQLTGTIVLTAVQDALFEGSETVVVDITGVTNGSETAVQQVTATILDSQTAPTVTLAVSPLTLAENGGTSTVTATQSVVSVLATTVSLGLSGTAIQGLDYTLSSPQIVIPAGQLSASITLTATLDGFYARDETVIVDISGVTNGAESGTQQVTATILDGDTAPTVTLATSSPTIAENGGSATATATQSKLSALDTTVTLLATVTAANGAIIAPQVLQIVIPAGQLTGSFTYTSVLDGVYANNLNVVVDVTGVTNGTESGTQQVTETILDGDTAPTVNLTVSPPTLAENGGTTTVTATQSKLSALATTVSLGFSGTATQGSDYALSGTQIVIPAGQFSASITLTAALDGVYASNETVIVDISGVANGAENGTQRVTATILDGDTAPTVTLAASPVTLGENGGSATVTATQSKLSAVDTIVALGFTGTATNITDYTRSAVQIVIPAGQLTGTIVLTAVPDALFEGNETTVVDITGVTNGTETGVQQVTATILDSQTAPTVTLAVSPLTLAENGGTTTVTATQSVVSVLATTVFLGFSGTAIQGFDYTLSGPQIVIPAGQLSGSITLTAALDGFYARDETVIVDISGVTNGAESGTQQVTATILDGDTAPVVNMGLSPTTISEDGGSSTVTVTQTKLSALDTTVALLATVTAANGAIIAPVVLQIVIPAGQLTGLFTYISDLDGVYANNLTVVVDITGVTNGTENGTQQVTGTIIDGDTAPTVNLTVSAPTLAENGGTATVTATQSKLSALDTTISLGFSGTATQGSNYALSGTQIVIPAGQLSASITLTAALDGVYANNETVIVDISGVSNGAENGTQQVTATILDGNTAPTVTLAVNPLTLAENGGSTTVTATQSKLSALDTTINLGFSGTATQGGDYTTSAGQIVIFAGQLTGSIVLTAVQDAVFEADQTIVVDITGVTNGTEAGTQQVTATIIDGNAAPTVTLAISPLTLAENAGTTTLTATQSILSILDTTVSLAFAGTANQGTNYTLSGTQIMIPAGQLSASITLTAALDGVYAQDHTVIVDISGVTNGAESGTQQVIATILDGSTAPTVTLATSSPTIAENGGSATATATQSKLSALDTTVALLATVTAANGAIISPVVLQIVIPAGQLTGSFTYTSMLDGVYANDLSVVVDVTGVTNGTESGTQQVTETVLDGDTPPTVNLTVSVPTLAENGGTATVTATQSKLSALDTTVSLGFSGSATQGSDYALSGTQIVIPAGQLSASITLTATLDGIYANNETVIVDISGVTNGAENGVQQVTATILDGDTAPTVTLVASPLTLAENGGSTTVTAIQSKLSAVDTTVLLAFSGTAIEGDDFVPSAAQIVIPAGQLTGSMVLTAVQDALFEGDETIVADITSVINGTETGTQQVTATIIENNTAPTVTLAISPLALAENGGTTAVTATQSLLSVLDTTVFLGFSGTATHGTNYTLSGTQIVIPAGQLSASITLTAELDGLYAQDHTVIVDISGVINGTESGTQQVTATILDGSTAPTVTLVSSSPTIAENGGSATATATQSKLSALDTTVTLLATVTAANGEIIPPTVLQIVIPAGQLTGSFTYTSVLNGVYANNLNVVVDVTGVTNGTESGTQQVTETIIDGDTAPTVNLTVSPATLSENGGITTLTATQSKLSALATTVSLGFSGSATQGIDYALTGTQIVIPAGQLSASITLIAALDGLYAENKTVIVDISGVTNGAENGTQQITATILDGDTAPTVTLAASPVTLGENGGSTTVTATQSKLSAVDTIVALGFTGTATQGGDYTPSAAQVVISAGQLTGSIVLTAVQDVLFEGSESIVVDISGVTNGTETGTQQVTATIIDDDTSPTVTLALSPATVVEAAGLSTVTATLSAVSGVATTVTLGFSGTAINITDYNRSAMQIVIPAGSLSRTMTLTAVQDTLFEGSETVIVEITGVTNGIENGTQQVTATIIDDDTPPTAALSLGPTTMAEATGVSTVTATLSAVSGLATTIALGFTGTATNGLDYTRSATLIVIPAGSLSAAITLTAAQDALFEGQETVIVDITGVTNGTESGVQQVTATIIDDDTSPTVTLALTPTTIAEAVGVSTVTATLSAVSGLATTVTLAFTGTATNNTDYTRSATQIVIPAGSLSGTVTLTAVQDTRFEGNETIIVDIAGVANGTESGTQQVTATIIDDDPVPTLTISDYMVVEGNLGTTNAVFAVVLSAPSGLTVSVVATAADDTADSSSDYTAPPPTTLTFAPGETIKTFTVVVNGDTLSEANERYFVDLTDPVNVTIAKNQGLGTILNDDLVPSVTLSVAPTTVAEAAGQGTVTATLSAVSGLVTTVTLGISGTATNVTDYTRSGLQIVIAAGSLSGTMTLTAVPDTLFEGNETVIVDIAGVTNGIESGTQQVTATIIDDDSSPTVTLALSPATMAEVAGVSTVTATLSAVSGLATTIALGFAGTATNGTDYIPTAAQIVIPAGSLSATMTLTGVPDSLFEVNETVIVDITGVTNGAENGTQQVTATLIDDDASPTVTLALSPTTMAESAGLSTVTATLSAVSGLATTINLGFTGTATNVTDYTRSAVQIVIPAGSLSGTITLTAVQDTLLEVNETVIVNIIGVTNGTESGLQQVTATLVDDDTFSTVTLAVSPLSLGENGGSITVTATQSKLSGLDTTVFLAFSGTATWGSDYTPSATQIVIPAGQLSASLTLTAALDGVYANDETVIVDISGVTNGMESGTQQVTATILDGDTAPIVSLTAIPPTLAENGGTTTLSATQSKLSALNTIVFLGFSGTAIQGSDFTLSSSQIVIPAGQLSASVTLTAELDGIYARNETVITDITGVTNGAESGTQQVTVAILDGDTAPIVNLGLSATTISEDGGSSTVTVTQTKLSALDTTVTLLATVTATNGAIIAPVVLQIVIPAGQLSGLFTYISNLDGVYANDLTVVVDITGVTNGTENGTQQVTGTIIDGDTPPTVNLTTSHPTLAENGGITTLTATQSKVSALDTTIFLGLSGTAILGSDYTLSATRIVIPAGQLGASITLTAALDGVYAKNETVIVDVSGVTNGAENGVQQVTVTILDGDTAPSVTLAVSPLTLAENGGSTTVTATQSKLSGLDTIVALGFTGTATRGGDYSPSANQIVIPAGQVTGSIVLTVVQDALFEGTETIVVDVTIVTNGAETGVQRVTATILESQTSPTVTLAVSPLTLAENGGTTTVTATQSVVSVLATTVSLGFSGTAIQGIDYTLSSPQIVIPAGQLNGSITLTATLDGFYARDETVIVDISGVTNGAESGTQQVTATILDGDTPPSVTLVTSSPTIAENGGSATATATQSKLSALDTTVTLLATVTAADGTIIAPQVLQIVIPAGQLTGSFTYTSVLDGVYANDLSVVVDITSVTNGTENGTQQVTETVLDGDTAPTVNLTISPPTLAESGGIATVTATQSMLSALDTMVSLGFSGSATVGDDYTRSETAIVIPAGQLSASITLTAALDGVYAENETVIVDISGVANGAENGTQQVTATILDGDTTPTVTLAVNPLTLAENGGSTTVTATQSKLSALDTIVALGFSGTAIQGGDYTTSAGQIVIFAGQLTGSIVLSAVPDAVFETDDTIIVDITGVTNGTETGTQQVTATIIDGNAAPTVTLAISPLTLAENAGTTTLTATQSVLSILDTTVSLGFTGTATQGTNYTLSGTQIVISAGQLNASITLTGQLDGVYAQDRTVIVDISGVINGAESGTQQVTATILDGSTAPTVTLVTSSPTIAEDGGSATATATQSKLSALDTTVALLATVTAADGTIITPQVLQIVIPAGQLTGSFTYTSMLDGVYANDLNVVVDVTGVTNGTESGTQQLTETIIDGDTAPTVNLTVSVPTLAENGGTATVTATQSKLSALDTTVSLGLAGTATQGINFTLPETQIVIPAGQLSGSITLTAELDGVYSQDETVIVDISGVTNGVENGTQRVTTTILDGDTAPTVTLVASPLTLAENGGSTTVTAIQSKLSAVDTTVLLAFSGTAVEGDDFIPSAVQIVIPARQLTGSMVLTAVQDTSFGGDETIVVDIRGVTNGAETGTQQVTATIIENNTAPTVTLALSPLTLTESGGTTTVIATQSLLSVLDTIVFLGFSGTATQGTNYSLSGTQIVIPAGQLSASITLTAELDGVYAQDHTVIVDISGVTNGAESGTQQATATILDGSTTPTVTLVTSTPTISENGGSATATATQSKLSALDTTVTLLATVTAANGEIIAPVVLQIVIPAGQLTGSFTYTSVLDGVYANDLSVVVDITGVTNGTESGTQQVTETVVDGDSAPLVDLTISAPTLPEIGGTTTLTATQSKLSALDTSVFLGLSGTAILGTNYTLSSTQIVIPAGQLSASITLTAELDGVYAQDHTVILDISGVVNGAESGTQQVTATILDGSTAPTVTLASSSPTIAEDGGSATATATQSKLSALDTTVALLATVTAANGEIIAPVVLQIVIPAGQLTGSFTYTSVLDGVYANDLSVVVDITGVTNGTESGTQQVTETVVDGDSAPTVNLTVSAPTLAENGGTATVTATQSKFSALDTTVFLAFSGTATIDSDYTSSAGQIVIPAGQLTGTIVLTAFQDALFEANEAIVVDLSGVTNGTTAGTQQITATIVDDDPAPTLSIDSISVAEADTGTTDAVFTITLSEASGQTVTVVVSSADGTATAPSDYSALPPTMLTFDPGEISKTIAVEVNGDLLIENNETYFVNLSSAINATLANSQGVGTITDNDQAGPVITIPNPQGTYHLGRIRAFISPDSTFTFNAATNPDYSQAVLTVSIVAGRDRRDRLSIHPQGDGPDRINVKSKKVFFSGEQIGTFKGGQGNKHPDLVITFNSNATTSAIDNLMRRLNFQAYRNIGTTRTITLQVTNINGVESNIATRDIDTVF